MSNGLGDVLVEQGVLDPDALLRAAGYQRQYGGSFGKALMDLNLASEQQIVRAVATQIQMRFADTTPGAVDPTAAALMPRSEAERLLALPVAFGPGNELLVAVADPGNHAALERVRELTGMEVVPALAVRLDLMNAISHLAEHDDQVRAAAAVAAASPLAASLAVDGAADAVTPALEVVEAPPGGRLAFEEAVELDLDGALLQLLQRGGSDLHLTAGIPPAVRVHGDLQPLEGFPIAKPNELRKALYAILTQKQREKFENELELDLSYTIPGRARFRVNVFQQRDVIGSVMRVIPFDIRSIEALGVPPQITNFAYLPRGFVLVTGPTGSGKSTTLASIIDLINNERAVHIMTVEDPIEFLHRHKKAVVNQRELGTDTHSFSNALKHVLRQDPDVILVGELRDLETIQIALTAAETGHLVFGTLHTQDAPQTVDRVIDVFPPHQQEQIRVMLAGALQGVVCQQLLKTADGAGRVVACEVMIATPAIRNLIRESKTHQMYSSIQAGKQHGMVTMDQSLAELVAKGKVTYDAALERCNNVADFNRLCGRA
jgi:twitching motility protein PilT